jgi:hypothetical protein
MLGADPAGSLSAVSGEELAVRYSNHRADAPQQEKPMAKAKPKSPFTGLWHIVSMTEWDEDYFNEEVQAFFEFEANGTGHFQFGYVQGYMDWRPGTRDGVPCVEWTWEGTDGADMTEMTGRGWAKLEDGELHGLIVIHLGDESGFVAERAKRQPPPRTKKRKR